MEGKIMHEPISGIVGPVNAVVVIPGLPDIVRIEDHWFDIRELVPQE